MDSQSQRSLAQLVRDERIASLGTLFHGAPLVSLVLFSAADDGSAIDVHVSRLAQHTQGLLESARVGLMIAEPDRESRNPRRSPVSPFKANRESFRPTTQTMRLPETCT